LHFFPSSKCPRKGDPFSRRCFNAVADTSVTYLFHDTRA
jgi:hypothetical protein